MATVDVLIPTFTRPSALAVTLTSLVGQTFGDLRIIIADQTEGADVAASVQVRSLENKSLRGTLSATKQSLMLEVTCIRSVSMPPFTIQPPA